MVIARPREPCEQLLVRRQAGDEETTGGRQQLDDVVAGDLVGHGRAGALRRDDAGAAQHRQLLREVRRFEAHERDELGHGAGTVAEHLEDAHAPWVREGLEQLGLDLGERPIEPVLSHLTKLSDHDLMI